MMSARGFYRGMPIGATPTIGRGPATTSAEYVVALWTNPPKGYTECRRYVCDDVQLTVTGALVLLKDGHMVAAYAAGRWADLRRGDFEPIEL